MLTKDLLTEGNKVYYGMDLQSSGFNNMLGMDSPMVRLNSKGKSISTMEYAEKAEIEKKDPDRTVRRNRFSIFMNM